MKKARNFAFALTAAGLVLGPATQASAAPADHFQAAVLSPAELQTVARMLKPLQAKYVPQDDRAKADGWIDNSQSFHIVSDQPGLRDAYLVTVSADMQPQSVHDWQMSAAFVLIDRASGAITVLPQHPVMNWSAYEVETVAFRDVRGDGSRAIVIDVQGVTGIGPNGADPFDVYAIYLPGKDGSFKLDDGLQKRLDGVKTLKDALAVAHTYFHAR